ncbi:Uncharacterised protein [Mycobacterium tuberculosis]|uniref:Uncharacterized protein n=1 Tax=Mycobacterium tuberculosis TaxID=1773 RepID=A0A916LHD8_MYCTX|nr:Uncharacterised protein [Mycobacterium tuberculosis]
MLHGPTDAARRAERLVLLLDADCPQISRPDVNVLEQLAVNRPQVCEICAVAQQIGILAEFDHPGLNEVVLGITQFGMRSSADPVPQDGHSGDEVALPIPFVIAGVPWMRHSTPVTGCCTGGGRAHPTRLP